MTRFACTSYAKILTDIRSFLRGINFDNIQFLDHVKLIHDFIIDNCRLPSSNFADKYNEMFIQ